MSKKAWAWIICGSLFPPLFVIPLIYYFFYKPLKDGVIGGSHTRFYYWGSLITSLSLLAGLPIRNLSYASLALNNPSSAQIYIFASFVLAILSIIILFVSIRNEPDKKQFLPIHNFVPDKLFLLCLTFSFLPLLSIIFGKTITLDQISHPFSYAIAVVFKDKSYFAVAIGFLEISITTAILEESFFRGILLRDYFKLGKFGQRNLLLLTALYFAICHIPIAFVFPFIFALFVNRIRLAYNNLLPTIVLHALWNANVTIAILFALNVNAPQSIKRTFAEELASIQHIWSHHNVEIAKRLFPKYQVSKSGMYTLEGEFAVLFIAPDSLDQNKFISAEVVFKKPLKGIDIQSLFEEDDWETSHFKKVKGKENITIEQELTCSKKLDLCFKPDAKGVQILHFGQYDSPGPL